MICPTIDRLSQYADGLLTGEELVVLRRHLEVCEECQHVVNAFKGEEQFIKETLQTPGLPEDFTAIVLDKLEPYQPKRKTRKPWKRMMLAVAAMTIIVSLSAALTPSFADWLGGLFSTEQVDLGLRNARESGLAERVNLEVIDKGITFKVEDVVADSSRVTLSYQIISKNGKVQNAHRGFGDLEDEVFITDQDGHVVEDLGMVWQALDDYGLYEFSLREHPGLEKITVNFNVNEINGVKGTWKLAVPIDLEEKRQLTTTLSLEGAKTSAHGVAVDMKKIQMAPSSYDLFYETSYTKEAQEQLEKDLKVLEEKHGDEIRSYFMFGSELSYHIENEHKEVIFQRDQPFEEENMRKSEFLQGTGYGLDPIGHMSWNESFMPENDDEKLTFVLDGVIKTVPTDFSLTVKPEELKKNPISFEYNGNVMKVTKVKKQSDYYLRKSLWPIGKRTSFAIKMEGERHIGAPILGAWALVDDKGDSYSVYGSGSNVDMTLTVYGLDKIPEEFTLHLLSAVHYGKLNDKWEVPLY